MSRYFFHIYNSKGQAQDEEGRELRDLSEARGEAIQGIRSILGDELRTGVIDLRGRVDIADAQGAVTMTVAFAEAIELFGAPQ